MAKIKDDAVEEAAETEDNKGEEQLEVKPKGDKKSSLHTSTDEVPVSEEYQKRSHELTSKANKHHLSHLRSKISDREDEIRAEERMAEKKSKVPEKFDTQEAPAGVDV